MPNTQSFLPKEPRTVEIIAFPNIQILDLTGPLQVFACANELKRAEGGILPYSLKVVSLTGGAITSSAGLQVVTERLSEATSKLDTLVIPGGMGVNDAAKNSELVAWIDERSAHATRIVSICSGTFLLAATGLLEGRRATTHWERCDELERKFPSTKVEPDPIFVQDGNIWSSAGVTAGIDLCLALVEQDLGRDVALAIARDLVVHLKRPGGQSQYSTALSLQLSSTFGDLHSWISDNLEEDLGTAALARKCGMSERNFYRKYVDETGTTPARAVERLRIEMARFLLVDTGLTIKTIAKKCGFPSEEILRRSFSRLLSTSPREYRRNWSNPQPDSDDVDTSDQMWQRQTRVSRQARPR